MVDHLYGGWPDNRVITKDNNSGLLKTPLESAVKKNLINVILSEVGWSIGRFLSSRKLEIKNIFRDKGSTVGIVKPTLYRLGNYRMIFLNMKQMILLKGTYE